MVDSVLFFQHERGMNKNSDGRFQMTKLSFVVFLFGNLLFLVDFTYGVGWVIGWLAMFLLETNREKILSQMIDFDTFSVMQYVIYLVGVVLWIAAPLALAYFFPSYINPIAIFGAYFASRTIMFLTKGIMKGER